MLNGKTFREVSGGGFVCYFCKLVRTADFARVSGVEKGVPKNVHVGGAASDTWKSNAERRKPQISLARLLRVVNL